MILTAEIFKNTYPSAAQKRDAEVEQAINAAQVCYLSRWIGKEWINVVDRLHPTGTIMARVYNGEGAWMGLYRAIGELAYSYMLYMQAQIVRMGAVVKRGQYSAPATDVDVMVEVSRRRAVARTSVEYFCGEWWEAQRVQLPETGSLGELKKTPYNRLLGDETCVLGEWKP